MDVIDGKGYLLPLDDQHHRAFKSRSADVMDGKGLPVQMEIGRGWFQIQHRSFGGTEPIDLVE